MGRSPRARGPRHLGRARPAVRLDEPAAIAGAIGTDGDADVGLGADDRIAGGRPHWYPESRPLRHRAARQRLRQPGPVARSRGTDADRARGGGIGSRVRRNASRAGRRGHGRRGPAVAGRDGPRRAMGPRAHRSDRPRVPGSAGRPAPGDVPHSQPADRSREAESEALRRRTRVRQPPGLPPG